jgi:DTW domain-containing protein YfiP
MGRSVVLAGAARCPGCTLPPRWCTCGLLPPVETRLAVHLLIHRHELAKPSSTGALVGRVVAGATCHTYQRANRYFPPLGLRAAELEPEKSLWILHPHGASWPAACSRSFGADARILLLDGTWRQAGEMIRSIECLGRRIRCVRLPDSAAAPSRYWLREQPALQRLSTAEALMAVFRGVGEPQADRRLGLHFELHVYATLLARGRRQMAERYLGHSPLLTAAPDILRRLHARERVPSPCSPLPPPPEPPRWPPPPTT